MTPELRAAVWARSGGRCERCGRAVDRGNWEGHVHHLVYRGHGLERLEDLLVSCIECHGRAHPGRLFLDREAQLARHAARRTRRSRPESDGLSVAERRSLGRGAGRWAWRPSAE